MTFKNKQKIIGQGSYASVIKYIDTNYDKVFAIKKAFNNLTDEEYKRFELEFQVVKNLKSKHVIEVYKFNAEKREYTMEYMDMTLLDYIQKNNDKLDYSERVSIVNQILNAFEYIHNKDILHRDISKTNILIKEYEDGILVKISDFGLVKESKSNLTREGTAPKGSLNDIEDLEKVGFKNYKIWHETYAITQLIYFVMTGRTNLSKYNRTEFRDFIDKGMSNNKEERYSNIEEVRYEFEKAINSKEVASTVIPTREVDYSNYEFSGIGEFDYSNNNGEYVIGKGDFKFTTKWSKASDVSIIAYSDPTDIKGIALVKSIEAIENINDIKSLNFTSRARTSKIGQTIVWINEYGNVAYTKILEIKDDSRDDDEDFLKFEYKIYS